MADNPDVRIGTAEREQALEALSRHLGDGRLTLPEFDERSSVVSSATTRGQLDAVFADLPSTTVTPSVSKPLERTASQTPAAESSDDDGWDWRKAVMAATPIVALVLFFVVPVSNSWLFFLLIPLVGAVIFGGDRSNRKRDRR
ncbi:DUF1707 domain-containing protein [Rhodococcus sp. BP-252]|uniref:DUF1707 SHOCT-like domain-containing protein n=1 Tax=unclassified Rhodococcus (in: high G+C Gram-positive bacteria) TaxID=192944 RepID=UPI001C9B337E|nr:MULTISPECIES: DUF1707 domain-containing protein [unclassified Rhodococcus (in: high G+C Gram-positive bacteria)]MBY6413810.1 DUF1707 domain-containing protein [Rhodococcus sp. BP-320]MBY6419230.1 DUF1707 domain-containing protein [Rhodococcus sp. BP-321]MBY6424119.1 DUF1707 domain-containing protein [Rhodococcus sp. BP-324]MBY6428617.1 DUF1707 domain-containing protein [Rhodococcus sp. BP-323]MBY6434369.1 DUF1707 domain-containing protein [Rhodococcus sp. BP-322]